MWLIRMLFSRTTTETGPKQTAEKKPLAGLPGGSETILVADDDNDVRHAVRAALRKCGYRVLEATTGVDAVLMAAGEQGPIDLVLADVVMPSLTTIELENRLRALRPRTPIAFMSGYIHDDAVRQSVITGPAPFLAKPFTLEQLAQMIRSVLDEKEN